MCSKGGLTAGQSAGIGFGLDAIGALAGFGQQRRDVARQNRAIARQNQLAINAYNTKNRNAELAWRNDKLDGDREVDLKWRETIDAISEAQLQARQAAGKSAIAQQQILTRMINAGAGREQAGRRSGGRAEYLAQAQQWAAQGAQAAFSRDSSILFQDKAGRNMAAFAGGKYVEYITGRPSPEAPPLLQAKKSMPSFFNTAIGIASSGLNRYQQWQDKKAPPALNNSLKIGSFNYDDYDGGAFQQQPSYDFNPQQTPSTSWQTMEVPSFTSQSDTFLQKDMNNYFDAQRATKASNDLGIDNSVLFGG